MKGQTQRLPLYYEHPQLKAFILLTVTYLSATATAVVVVRVIVAAAAKDDDKKNDPSAAIAVSVSEKVTHMLSSFRLHYHIIIKS